MIRCDPAILGGVSVFAGARVPVKALLDYLESGLPLGDFLEDFPSVNREMAIAVLELAKELIAVAARFR